MEAKNINAQGVYCVGCQDGDASALPAMEQLTPDKVIQLQMRAEDNVDRKIYSLNDLKDLQSKLMLIAAKASQGKEDVDRFLDVSFHWQFLNLECIVEQNIWATSIFSFCTPLRELTSDNLRAGFPKPFVCAA